MYFFYLLIENRIEVYFFFFSSRRRHTRCLSDWSSDVCSSDLRALDVGRRPLPGHGHVAARRGLGVQFSEHVVEREVDERGAVVRRHRGGERLVDQARDL